MLEYENEPRSPYLEETNQKIIFTEYGEWLNTDGLPSYQRFTENILAYHFDEYANGEWNWE